MRFCNCGKLLGSLFPCRPDMFNNNFQYNLTRISENNLLNITRGVYGGHHIVLGSTADYGKPKG